LARGSGIRRFTFHANSHSHRSFRYCKKSSDTAIQEWAWHSWQPWVAARLKRLAITEKAGQVAENSVLRPARRLGVTYIAEERWPFFPTSKRPAAPEFHPS
jgi:hypothetical protein